MKSERRYTKREVLGQLRVELLFHRSSLDGIDATSSRWEVLGAFMKAGEARAERLIETDGGFVVLQSIPHRPNTGAIYVYHEETGYFLWMRFDRDDDLNGSDFDQAVWAYRLLKWADIAMLAYKTGGGIRQVRAANGGARAGRQGSRSPNSHGIHLVS